MQPASDLESFMRLFLEYEPEILRSVMHFVNRTATRRIQTTLSVLSKSCQSFNKHTHLGTWNGVIKIKKHGLPQPRGFTIP